MTKLRLGLFTAVWIASDQWTKHWCDTHLRILERKPFFGQEYVVISRTLNSGLAFDQFSWVPPQYISPYIRYAPTAILAVMILLASLRWRVASLIEKIGYCMLVAGGTSNMADHWRGRYVTDTFQVYIGQGEHIPMNLADVALVMGVVLVLIMSIREIFRSEPVVSGELLPS